MKNFSNPVFAARNRLGMSQQEFADLIGVSNNYIWMLEDGRKPISEKIQKKLDALPSKKSEIGMSNWQEVLLCRAVEALERIAAALESVAK